MIIIKKFIFFWGGGRVQIIVHSLSSKIIYHKKSLSVNWLQNGFKIVIYLFGKTVWKECLNLKVVCIFAKVHAKG